MSLPNHGANPHHVYRNLGLKIPDRIIDFSENVNPLGPPHSISAHWDQFEKFMMVYPDPLGEPFRSKVANYHKVEPECIFVGNGAAEVFSLLAERYRGKKAILVHPTFSEYEATLSARHVEIVNLNMKNIVTGELPLAEMKYHMDHADVLYLCTPNNPTGTLPDHRVTMDLVNHAKKANCDIVLDEAFIDFISEDVSFITEIASSRLIIVRSMTKMYAMPGLRLGYMVAATSIVQEMRHLAPHWNVNGLAIEIGSRVLMDEKYREEAIQHSVNMRTGMKRFLEAYGCEVTQSQVNYLLFRLPKENSRFYRDLLVKGIVLRHTENFPGLDGHWFRIGMKNEEDMELLKMELKSWFEAH